MHSFDNLSKDDMNHVGHGVWIGSHYVLKSAHHLTSKGIKHVVNAAIEFITETPELINWDDLHRNGIEVHNTYWDDTMAQLIYPSTSMDTAVQKIDEVVRSGKPILVNCAMGKSRSTSLVIAYLMARHNLDYDQALAQCKRARPLCQPNANFERQLRQLDVALRNTPHHYNNYQVPNQAPHPQPYAAPAPPAPAQYPQAQVPQYSPPPYNPPAPAPYSQQPYASPQYSPPNAYRPQESQPAYGQGNHPYSPRRPGSDYPPQQQQNPPQYGQPNYGCSANGGYANANGYQPNSNNYYNQHNMYYGNNCSAHMRRRLSL